MSGIGDAIKLAAGTGVETYIRLCMVDSVNEEKRTIECTPLDGGAKLTDVNMQAVTEGKGGLLIIPKKNSHVAVGFFDKNNAVVLLYSEIEKILLDAGDTISFNGGKNDGLVVVSKMVGWMEKVHSDLTTLQASLASIPVTGAVPAGTLPVVANCVFSPQTPLPVQQDFENDKIKH